MTPGLEEDGIRGCVAIVTGLFSFHIISLCLQGGNRFETFNTWQQSAGGRGQEGGGRNDSNFGFRQPRG